MSQRYRKSLSGNGVGDIARFPAFFALAVGPRLPWGRYLPLLFAGLYLACGPSLLTAQFIWDAGGGDTNWSTAANWGASVPTFPGSDSGTVDFQSGSAANQDLGANYELNVLTFNSSLGAGSFTHSGSSLLFDRQFGGSGNQPDIFKSHTGNATISNNIVIETSGSNGNLQILGSGSGTLTLSGTITGSGGGLQARITKFNGFDLVLSNAGNSLNGRIRIRGTGTLESQADGALDSPFIQIRENATLGITTVSQTYDEFIQIENGQTGNVDVASGLSFTFDGSGTGSASGDYLELGNATSVFDKEGLGELIVDGSGDGAGAVNIRAGTMEIRKADTLGLTTGSTTVISGATLDLNGNGSDITFAAEPLTISGVGVSSLGALRNTGDGGTGNVWTGSVNLGANSNIGVASGTDLEISGVIADGASTFDITKVENGILELSATNTFDGTTTINAGTLSLLNTGGLGTSAAGTPVTSGATLDLAVAGTVTGESLTLNGTGVGGNGALTMSAAVGLRTWTGSITLGSASTIGIATGNLIISGAVGDSGGTPGLTKIGSGGLRLSGTNTFDGDVTVTVGILQVENGAAIADTASVSLANTAATNFVLLSSETIGDLAGGGATGGNVNLNANTLTTGDASNTTYSGAISGTGALIKQGSGNFTLNGSSAYSGATSATAGTLTAASNNALGGTGGGTSVSSGATLALSGGTTITGESLTLTGVGDSSNGALNNASGTNTWDGNITLDGNTTIKNEFAGTDTLVIGASGADRTISDSAGGSDLTVTFTGDGDTFVRAQFTENDHTINLIKSGSGTTTLDYGGNSDTALSVYTGTTTVNGGQLNLDMGASDLTPLTPLTDTVTISSGTIETQWVDQLGDAITINIGSSGVLDIDATTNNVFLPGDLVETVGPLNLDGGAGITTTDGATLTATLELGNTVTRTSTGSSTATISGRLSLGASTRTFSVADEGTSTNELDVSALVSGTGGLTKTGSGVMTLSGTTANTYSGTTTVTTGILALNKSAGTDALFGDLTIGDQSGIDVVRLDASNQFNTSSDILFNGGTLDLNGNSEADLGTIDVDFNSNIDFSGASGKITFDNSSAVSWSTGVVIEADNWAGSLGGNGADELEVLGAGLTATQLGQVRFTNVATNISARDHHAVFSSGDANELVPLDSNEFIWDKDVTAGSWDTGTNWLAGHAPDSSLARAVFTESGVVGNVTVSGGSDVAFNLNRLIFRDTSTRTITVDSGNAYIR